MLIVARVFLEVGCVLGGSTQAAAFVKMHAGAPAPWEAGSPGGRVFEPKRRTG